MGGGNSKEVQLEKYGQYFSAQERKCLSKTFHIIAGYEEATYFSTEEFQKYISRLKMSISKEVASGIFRALSGPELKLVQFADFVQNTSAILKGSCSQKAEFICKVCSSDPSRVDVYQLRALLLWFMKMLLTSECAKSVFPQSSFFKASSDGSQLMLLFIFESLKDDSNPDTVFHNNTTVSTSALERWLTTMPLVVQILETIFAFIFYHQLLVKGKSVPGDILAFFGVELYPDTGRVIPDHLLLPLKVQHPIYRVTMDSEILDHSSLMLLNSYMPHTIRGRYYPLFSSSKHGESFSTFCKVLIGCTGPTLILVKDKDGHVFGGFASTAWKFDPNFTGDPNCFLFQLFPSVGIYQSTSYNQHFMYLEQSAQTLPNGLMIYMVASEDAYLTQMIAHREGMGGQMDYFGLWLSADFGKGHSKAKPKCTTFSSPQLSAKEEFEVQLLELWGVGDPVIPETTDGGGGSILDKDKIAHRLLEMAGKKMHSEGLREEKEVDD